MIIGLDLGGNVGVAWGEPGGAPELCTLKLSGPVGPMMSQFEGYLRSLLREWKVSLIAYEKPIIPFGKPSANSFVTAQRVFGQAGIILKLAHEYEVLPTPIQVRSVRKSYCGSAKAKPDDILRACYAIGVHPYDDHAADACLIWRAGADSTKKTRAA